MSSRCICHLHGTTFIRCFTCNVVVKKIALHRYFNTNQSSFKHFSKQEIKEARSFHFPFRYIDDVCFINNLNFFFRFHLYIHQNLELTKQQTRPPQPHFYLEFVIHGHLSTRIYDKRDDYNFEIINPPHLSSNIPNSSACKVYIPKLFGIQQLVAFVKRHKSRSRKVMNQVLNYDKTFESVVCTHTLKSTNQNAGFHVSGMIFVLRALSKGL